MTQTVQSADGSSIAYDKSGTGPAVILVGGAFSDRQGGAGLAPLLAAHFSVYAYDRRGRGDSTEAGPFAVEREVEDLAALVEAAGGSACVYGHSSGAVLALEAAARGVPIAKLALYEPPFTGEASDGSGVDESWGRSVQAALDAGDRDQATTLFMAGTGADEATIAGMKNSPWWPGLTAIAHTAPYDIALMGDGVVPERYRQVDVPTLLLYGGDSPAWASDATGRLAEVLPDAKQVAMQGQGHGADPAVLAPEISDFFRAASEETVVTGAAETGETAGDAVPDIA